MAPFIIKTLFIIVAIIYIYSTILGVNFQLALLKYMDKISISLAVEGAIQGIKIKQLTDERKGELKEFYHWHKSKRRENYI